MGVTAICDDFQVVSDPQLALPVAEAVQRKILESGRSLNIAACLCGRTVFYEFPERFAPELLAGAMEDYW